ncbi:HAMP domain-containing sensor histidine kinase [Lysinibacillus sp. 54212]|uniref:HAMP domain-containing sensor histidine kinase n=1 Tax=Lysinibacillus sp. 54212 TaxID=3119829 RepID=UPI002FC75D31
MKGRLFLTLFLMFLVIVSGYTFLTKSTEIIGQDYFESTDFKNIENSFQEGLKSYVLNPITPEKAKEKITVSDDEIAQYRNYYGTLAEQITKIKEQYAQQLGSEDAAVDQDVQEALIKERDAKIADVKANFEDTDTVEKKIRAIKERAVDAYFKERANDLQQFKQDYKYFSYNLTNTDTDETFSNNLNYELVFKKNFTEDNPLVSDGGHSIYLGEYIPGGSGVSGEELYLPIERAYFSGTISISNAMLEHTDFQQNYKTFKIQKISYFTLWILGIIALILLLTVLKPNRAIFSAFPEVEGKFKQWTIDIQLAIPITLGMLGYFNLIDFEYTIEGMAYYYDNEGYRGVEIFTEYMFFYLFDFAVIGGTILTGIWLYDVLKAENRMVILQNSILFRIKDAITDSFLNRSIGVQSMFVLAVFFLGGVGITPIMMQPALLLIYIPCFFFVLLPVLYVFLRRIGYLNRIMQQTKDMAEGRLTNDIKVKGKSPFADHARHLNDLREGVRKSMSEQAKSERLKTELITNVSHDLRTPLTSIITYTDLLKNPELTEEERLKYVNILDKKSERLKTLIEDLFDVSKMASGNIELVKQRVDLAQLLQQAVGEQKEDFVAAGLDLRVSISEQPIFAYVDGQKWWRVIDNLVINARKYSLEGTRVYVTLKQENGVAEFTVKNVAKYELGDNVEELTERFKRADTSRHTDGSGLGLAIAQSIIDLHNAQLNIEVDGDLFKVKVVIPTA